VRKVGRKLQIHWLLLQNASTNTTINVRNCCLGCNAGLRRRKLPGADHHVIEVSVASRMMHEAVSFDIGQRRRACNEDDRQVFCIGASNTAQSAELSDAICCDKGG
jgi:hypothetical protein